MVMIAAVAGGLFEHAVRHVLECPEVTGSVVAFDLGAGSGAAPEEFFGEGFGFIGDGLWRRGSVVRIRMVRNDGQKSGCGGTVQERAARKRCGIRRERAIGLSQVDLGAARLAAAKREYLKRGAD